MTSATQSVVRLYYIPRFFPCGPQSACCGPAGQSEEELQRYVDALHEGLPDVEVQTIDASGDACAVPDAAVVSLLGSFGPAGCPIFAVGGEVVSMGPPKMDELIGMIKGRLAGSEAV